MIYEVIFLKFSEFYLILPHRLLLLSEGASDSKTVHTISVVCVANLGL